ncbi:hypothetical protein J3L16_00455 [Alteromonas sp. 5E99-2]|uniref:hypothetical protein n=1 Tax=Alteromonas sp. 5E99-2 TaxID=2817683 RepID=UPI001A998624|nr:hypothetical protein [Alteromonas sp. 5E99-2]MBO1254148.1 hypothetical protein [Alteromonas sp. 5E99-2]
MNIKRALTALLVLPFSFHVSADTAIEHHGFECADAIVNVIPMLGRGNNFPEFLINDVETELKRQNKHAEVTSLTCDGKPELKGTTKPVTINGETKSSLSSFTATFPLTVLVKEPKRTVTLKVNHIYFVDGMDSGTPQKVTQTFQVLEQK